MNKQKGGTMKTLAGVLIGLVLFLCAAGAQAQCTLSEGLDAPDVSWSTAGTLGGGPGWFCQETDSYYGGSAVQSYPVPDDNSTWFETTITISEQQLLSFYWKVSSQPAGDYLRFWINAAVQDSISGEVGWTQQVYSLSPGTYTLKWEYWKDYSGDNGTDCGWVDKVELKNPPVTDLLEHYAGMYAAPSIPTPLFAKSTAAKAQPDECYDNSTPAQPDESGNCESGEPKTNQAYVWGLTRSGNLWFGTAANVLCLVMSIFPLDTIEAPSFVCEFDGAEGAVNRLGDWRPPQIFEYNPDTMTLIDRTPLDMIANPTWACARPDL
jgi:hypothetical protein